MERSDVSEVDAQRDRDSGRRARLACQETGGYKSSGVPLLQLLLRGINDLMEADK